MGLADVPTNFRPLPLLATVLFCAACSWVKLDPGAEQVRLLEGESTAHCTRLGQTNVSVRDRVAATQRRATRVEQELATLARNSALAMGGDVVVPIGPVEGGSRPFAVYRCN